MRIVVAVTMALILSGLAIAQDKPPSSAVRVGYGFTLPRAIDTPSEADRRRKEEGTKLPMQRPSQTHHDPYR